MTKRKRARQSGKTETPSRPGEKRPVPPPRSRRRKWCLRAVAMSLPFLALLILEMILRAAGFGGHPPLFVTPGRAGSDRVVRVNTQWSSAFFPGDGDQVGTCPESAFLSPKPAGTLRVFMVGASFVRGWPHTPGLTSSTFLERALQQAWPDRRVEVINLGTTAVASYPVWRMALEALEYEPDLIIACTGHNEFFGAAGVASRHAGSSPGMIHFAHQIRALAMTQAFAQVWRTETPANANDQALIEKMAGENQIPPNAPARNRAADNVAAHLQKIASACRDRQVPLVICTLPSNEHDVAPIGAHATIPVSEEKRTQFEKLLRQGQALLTSDAPAAERILREAERIYADHAVLQYALGRACEAAGEMPDAASAYRRARDLDPMPWRATTGVNDAIRRTASDNRVPLADLELLFSERAASAAPGWDLMDDHVHPSVRGQALVAYGILQALAQAPPQARVPPEKLLAVGTIDEWLQVSGDNVCERFRTAWQMKSLFSRPPLEQGNGHAAEHFERILRDCLVSADPVIRNGLEWWVQPEQKKVREQSISGVVGKLCAQTGRVELAEPLFELARLEAPEFSSGRLDYTLALLSSRIQLQGHLTDSDRALALEAIAQGRAMSRWDRSETMPLVHYVVGSLFHLVDDHEQAVDHLKKAWEGGDPAMQQRADLMLIQTYITHGHPEQARSIFRRARAEGLFSPAYAAYERRLAP